MEHSLFLNSSLFFRQQMVVPGGMLSYLGAFFSQHFYYPWVGDVRNMEEINSPDTESYHSWSSNGRWVVFSSRRYDGNYTRPFIAHIDNNGHSSKPFELPCEDPDYHRQFLKCYNVPEFMRGPVTISPQQFADAMKQEAKNIKYLPQP